MCSMCRVCLLILELTAALRAEAKAMPGLVNSRGLKAADLCKATKCSGDLDHGATCHSVSWLSHGVSCAVCQDTMTYQAIIRNMGPEQAELCFAEPGCCWEIPTCAKYCISPKFYKQSEALAAKQSEALGRQIPNFSHEALCTVNMSTCPQRLRALCFKLCNGFHPLSRNIC